ncbi:MAG: hypothetical protein V4547_18780 [Bacteroidota bacterium]
MQKQQPEAKQTPSPDSGSKEIFSKKIAKQIAAISFGYTLDCILCYSDSGYSFQTEGEQFEQNFEEDLIERGLKVNERRIRIIVKQYNDMKDRFEKLVRSKYY